MAHILRNLHLTGNVSLCRIRDLGNLQDRASVAPSFMGKLRNWFNQAPNHANEFDGGIAGTFHLQPRLSGMQLCVPALTSDRRQRLNALLAQNVPVTSLASEFDGYIIDYGVLSTRMITNGGANYIAGAFANGSVSVGNFKYHGFGLGNAAEQASDSALQTELTTQYQVNGTRPTGSQNANTNIYTSVATLTPGSGGTLAIVEHGLFDHATGPLLWDRSVFAPVNLSAGSDSLQVTYQLTMQAGG